PDGDTIGSCLALNYALERPGKEVYLFWQDEIPYNLSFLEGSKRFHREPFPPDMNYDLVIALDCSDAERMGEFQCLLELGDKTINIDHPVSNTEFAHINWVDATAAATCEMVYKLVDFLDTDIVIDIADALYAGLSTDTGNFSFSN